MNTFQLPELTIEKSAEILPPHILLLGYVGSTAQVKDEAVRLFNLAAVARENSPLPEKPDAEAAEELLMQIVRTELGRVY